MKLRASGDIHSVVLTERGCSEAEAAGKALSHITFERAVCSGLPRTRETAEIVLSFVKNAPKLEVDADLLELRGGALPPVKSREELIAAMNSYFARAHEPGPVRPLVAPRESLARRWHPESKQADYSRCIFQVCCQFVMSTPPGNSEKSS